MQRLPVGKFLGFTGVSWGIILMTTPACTNFAGIAANRFMLGLVEAAVNPGFVLVMSMWYTAQEQPLRLEIYYCTNGIATMFGGLLGYAIGHITTGLARWMYVFLIFGSMSLVAGLATLWFLPDLPSTARFLSQRERAVAVERVAANRQGVKNHNFKVDQAWQAVADPKTWILFILAVSAQVPNAAITSFTSLIIKDFGFDTLGTQYLQIPGGFVQFAALLGGGFICSKWPNSRCPTMMVANLICIAGAAMLVGLPDSSTWGRLVALWLCYFQGLGFSMSLTMISSNISGFTKKQLTAAIMFTGYCVGNMLVFPWNISMCRSSTNSFTVSDRRHSRPATTTTRHTLRKRALTQNKKRPALIIPRSMLVGYTVKLLSVVVLYVYMWSANKKRDRDAANSGLSQEEIEKAGVESGMQDMTELDNKAFRYVL